MNLNKAEMTSEERLQRVGEAGLAEEERNGRSIANLIVIGASAGGHRALVEILKSFPPGLPAAIVLLLHLPEGPSSFKNTLQRFSRLPVVEVTDRERLHEGCVFIPPPGITASFSPGMIFVNPKHDVPTRPATTINRLFESAAASYGERVIGVILTGLLKDGTAGLRAVHAAGGLTVVQDPREAEYPEMPANAMEGLPVTFCLNLADIGPTLELLVRRTTQFETGLQVAIRTLRDRTALLVRLIEQSGRNPGTRDFLRDQLISLRRDVESIDDLVIGSLTEHC